MHEHDVYTANVAAVDGRENSYRGRKLADQRLEHDLDLTGAHHLELELEHGVGRSELERVANAVLVSLLHLQLQVRPEQRVQSGIAERRVVVDVRKRKVQRCEGRFAEEAV